MVLWLRVRRVWSLVLALVVMSILLRLASDQSVMVPTAIGGGTSAILWSTFLPLGWAAVTGYSLELRGIDAEARAAPRLRIVDAMLVVVSSTLVIGVLAVLSSGVESRSQIVAHLLIVTGVTVSASVLFGAGIGILATTMLVLVTFSYGVTMSGAEFVRILQPEGNTAWSLGIGVVAYVASLGLILFWHRPLKEPEAN